MTDTIFALATPPGRGAIAVIRLSGPDSRVVLERLGAGSLTPRLASLRTLVHAGEHLDDALVLRFVAPASYTGEDAAELHLHGGAAVVEGVTRALLDLGLRPAEPGEFTRRAFEHGKLDLTRAEAVADLIDAESDAQRRQALGQLGGALAETYGGFRARLLRALALVEAEIDFPDEEVPDNLARQASPVLGELAAMLEAALADGERGRRVRDGYSVVLIGETNAGKSSLFNALVAREAAIVTDIPGTTRDVLDARLEIGGYVVTLSDTAGLRDSADPIEAEGVRRARARAESADLRLWVRAPGDADGPAASLFRDDDLVVKTKSDLGVDGSGISVSVRTGDGLEALHDWLAGRLGRDLSGSDFPPVTRARHAQRLGAALSYVRSASVAIERGRAELAGDDLRAAGRALSSVTGEVGVEEVLGEVFASFCIGK
ncbi:tRNA uridine-5-carboxymethylaminomethyl(34) synthesis GTPase MnmE [Brevundimonas lutea]|uniref:tRNA uridine-5-carboxymethylaminomethyl(34) synthesis GTPase MnmE n=1 Tax=Brevundimonas lutea TaxID=2293980 RepID=UPI000F022DFF|nr:tRNA uridine-5-carboxymethylaminomethyl(34) synthesis GTPase MnmE [Brevundimonas lutea]